jgi:hypothetical protein
MASRAIGGEVAIALVVEQGLGHDGAGRVSRAEEERTVVFGHLGSAFQGNCGG